MKSTYDVMPLLAEGDRTMPGAASASIGANKVEARPAAHKGVPAITFAGVSKSYGPNPVLVDFDLAVQPGEKVTLIGPSGSGKTTVLRLAMTLEKPSAGDILLFGESMFFDRAGRPKSPREEAAIRRQCGMVFQQFNLFPHMTVLDNLLLAPRTVLKLPKAESEALALEHLRLVGLSEKTRAYPGQLSGGQQQRIAIARALVLRPKILLLDEITSALDPELAGEVLDVVRNVAREMNISLLIVTHEMRFAREVSDRIVMFDAGRVVEQGPPEQIFGAPRSERTRAFLQSVLNH
ncbi:amino acid ABC transporter ATP-binding protein [Rhodoligotrophos defluvii]|uniref:amino acid ABC transporter ATP-binding protein n=1 Tax=Rhodoligotrophos defluvii TaxID=2561934 RepID=UPI001EF034AF|nr:amino acid ABC transporter ATP-binding protein [Rhodoligotrophos defluvii]